MKYLNPKRSIKPQKVIKILKEHSQEVTHEQAELISTSRTNLAN